jgi:TPR repeat protein
VKEAARWWNLAADQKNERSTTMVRWFSFSDGNSKDLRAYVRLYERLETQRHVCRLFTTQNNYVVRFQIGCLYMNGIVFRRNLMQAYRWLRLSAVQGHASAQLFIGYYYLVGMGVPKDVKEAIRWYGLSADQGLPQAQYVLAHYLLRHGKSSADDFQKAILLLCMAAQKGYAVASAQLSNMCMTGYYGKKNLNTAKQLRKQARMQYKYAPAGSRAFEYSILWDIICRGGVCTRTGCDKAENPNASQKRRVSKS